MHTKHGIILGFSSQPTSANRDGSIFKLHLESDPFTISTAPTWFQPPASLLWMVAVSLLWAPFLAPLVQYLYSTQRDAVKIQTRLWCSERFSGSCVQGKPESFWSLLTPRTPLACLIFSVALSIMQHIRHIQSFCFLSVLHLFLSSFIRIHSQWEWGFFSYSLLYAHSLEHCFAYSRS